MFKVSNEDTRTTPTAGNGRQTFNNSKYEKHHSQIHSALVTFTSRKFTADLATFSEEISNGKFYWRVSIIMSTANLGTSSQ